MHADPSHPYAIIDVFTDTPLAGNQLAVFTEGEAVPGRLMLRAARELNLSETVFVLPGDHDADATVRIFTPQVELPFAGHPILGTAFIVAAQRGLGAVRLRTPAGVIHVTLKWEDGAIVYGEMEQPIPAVSRFERREELLQALGVSGTLLPTELYSNGPSHVMVALADVEQLAALAPDLGALARFGPIGIDCFAPGEPDAGEDEAVRIRCRVFCPGMGIPEDPATGSAAGPLALHLARHGWCEAGRTVAIIQGSEIDRPSELIARVEGTAEQPTRITVGGCAVPVAHGRFRLQ